MFRHHTRSASSTAQPPRSDAAERPRTIGRFTGEVAEAYATPEWLAWLADLPAWLASPSAEVFGGARNVHVRVDATIGGVTRPLMVKSFRPGGLLRDMRDRGRGSKACRTWLAAHHLNRHGVGTPEPIGYVERWDGGRLRESYFLAAYEAQAQTLREALIALFHDDPECVNFMQLLECVADGVRAMHDSGFVHLDLGSQNILLTPEAPGRWGRFQVVDLNRGRIRDEVTLRERALDLSRLEFPSHLRRLFMRMYARGMVSPEMQRWDKRYWRMHRFRVRSRRWRHPIREARLARESSSDDRRRLPAPRDLWIWDERSAQPIPALLSAERNREYPRTRTLKLIRDTAASAARVWREYRPLVEHAFRQPVDMRGRIGMAVEPSAGAWSELELLSGLGRMPALVRFCHHESHARRQIRAELVRSLHAAGHPVAIALLQDRNAVRRPHEWRAFVMDVLAEVGPLVDVVEFGHAINRTKWGIWGFEDLDALYAPLVELHERFPQVRLVGPAVIDFEYSFVLSALRQWPANVRLAALSHHLYVDRRGAPESPQGPFAAVEKFALARAIARSFPHCDDRLVVSEVNWPLEGQGPYSPVSSPHRFPGQGSGKAAVGEDDYADYMLRYLCLATASGLVDRVYWWRLVARGYGLVDDTDPQAPRLRPAYTMLRNFLATLGESTFTGARIPRRDGKRHGEYRLSFVRGDGERVVIAYAHGPARAFPADLPFGHVEDAFGSRLAAPPASLTGRPVYLRHCAAS